jgi:hypothetical protein
VASSGVLVEAAAVAAFAGKQLELTITG